MGAAIGEMLPLAIGIAISPLPIIAVILMLTTPKGRSNGLAFLGGWLLGLAAVGAIVLVVTDAYTGTSSEPSRVVSAIKLALGLLLLILAWRKLDKRPKPGDEAPLPKWMRALDSLTPGRSLVFAALLSGLKPKNLILNASAAAGIAQSGLGGPQQAVALLLLVVVGSLGIIAPVAVYFAMGDRAAPILEDWKTWLVVNNATVMVVLFVIFGVTLIGKGIAGLS